MKLNRLLHIPKWHFIVFGIIIVTRQKSPYRLGHESYFGLFPPQRYVDGEELKGLRLRRFTPYKRIT